MPAKIKDTKPLALENTLRDLALLRASELDISSLVPAAASSTASPSASKSDVDVSVEESRKFMREARAALRIHNRGDAETQGGRVEEVRDKLDELSEGLQLPAGA